MGFSSGWKAQNEDSFVKNGHTRGKYVNAIQSAVKVHFFSLSYCVNWGREQASLLGQHNVSCAPSPSVRIAWRNESQLQELLHSIPDLPRAGASFHTHTTKQCVLIIHSSVSHFCSKLWLTDIPNQFLPSATGGNIPFPAQEFQFGSQLLHCQKSQQCIRTWHILNSCELWAFSVGNTNVNLCISLVRASEYTASVQDGYHCMTSRKSARRNKYTWNVWNPYNEAVNFVSQLYFPTYRTSLLSA